MSQSQFECPRERPSVPASGSLCFDLQVDTEESRILEISGNLQTLFFPQITVVREP